MNKRTRNRQPAPVVGAVEAAAQQVLGPVKRAQELTVQQESITVQVALPPPEMLQGYEAVRAGTMELLIRWSEEEQNHRRKLESDAQTANISAQQAGLALNEKQVANQRDVLLYQASTVRTSDLVGQVFGWLLCLAAMGLAAYLAVKGHEVVASVLAALPTAAVIQSFRTLNRQEAKKEPQSVSK
jgi:uncharacterized membrane protein